MQCQGNFSKELNKIWRHLGSPALYKPRTKSCFKFCDMSCSALEVKLFEDLCQICTKNVH